MSNTEKLIRLQQALKETETALKRAGEYFSLYQDEELIEFYQSHIETLHKMIRDITN